MLEQSFSLNYNGYWREPNISSIPNQSGVYTVYTCVYQADGHTVSIKRLIYIGESADVRTRLQSHEKWDEWKRLCYEEEEICLSFAPVDAVSRERVEASLIFRHKPPLNVDYKDNFPFDKTTITCSGKTALLNMSFAV